MKNGVYFISGIDTNVGKSYATGYLAKELLKDGKSVITQKMIQTGNKGYAEDIVCHRKIMDVDLYPEDKDFTTMPEIYSYPCSPHLAAQIDQRPINFTHIENCTEILADRYDIVLVEGAGGLMVPFSLNYWMIDYIQEKNYPLILVVSGKLGSINHTLLSLEIIKQRGIELSAVLYNLYSDSNDDMIRKDTYDFIQKYLEKNFPDTSMQTIPLLQH